MTENQTLKWVWDPMETSCTDRLEQESSIPNAKTGVNDYEIPQNSLVYEFTVEVFCDRVGIFLGE